MSWCEIFKVRVLAKNTGEFLLMLTLKMMYFCKNIFDLNNLWNYYRAHKDEIEVQILENEED